MIGKRCFFLLLVVDTEIGKRCFRFVIRVYTMRGERFFVVLRTRFGT
jgi:hypothetical protein